VANVLERAIPFLLLPFLTRLLTTFDYGVITTFNAIRTNIMPVISMATPAAVGRAYFDRRKPGFDFHSYIYNALIVNFILLLVVVVILLSIHDFIPGISKFSILWILFISIYVWASATGGIKVKLWLYQKKPYPYGAYKVTKILSDIGISIFLIAVFFYNWKGRILGIGITEMLFCGISLFLLCKYDRLHFYLNLNYIKDILKFGLPLLPHSLGWMLIGTADKFFLNAFEGVSSTGVYGVGYAIGSSLAILAAPIDISAEPIIYEKLSQSTNQTQRKLVIFTYLYFFLLILIAIGIWLFSPFILKIFIGEKFHGAGKYIFWISLAYAFFGMYRLLSKYIVYSKKTYLLPCVTFTSGIIALGANYFLIKLNGSIGAAQATFIAYLSTFLLSLWFVNRLYSMPWFSIFTFLKK